MPQTGADLVAGGYPIANAVSALLGGSGNATLPNVPVKSNLYLGLGGLVDTATPVASGVVLAAAIPVVPGDTFTRISVPQGATAASAITANWAALYAGNAGSAGALIGQTAVLTASVAASSLATFTFAQPQTITSVQAPYGYVFAAYSATGTTVPSLVSVTGAAAAQYPWFATSPYMLAGTFATAAGSTAPATMTTITRTSNPPVFLLY
jgi:hypothetical protein